MSESKLLLKRRFWFLAFPDIKKPIGGIKQIHRISEVINTLGFSSYIVQDHCDFKPSWFTSNIEAVSKVDFFQTIKLDKLRDVIILPETFISALKEIYPSIPKIIFNQNGGYTYGIQGAKYPSPSHIHNYYHDPIVKQVWCVSEFDRLFLSRAMQLPTSKVFRIFNSVESTLEQLPLKKNLICYMPRKNKNHSDVVIELLKKQSFLEGWKILPITGLSHSDVLNVLSFCQFFLSFGHPEGFGLPIAESLSLGCSIVGYNGLGGKELFDLAGRYGCSYSVDYGDFYGFVHGLSSLIHASQLNSSDYIYQSTKMAEQIRSIYSESSMTNSVLDAIEAIAI